MSILSTKFLLNGVLIYYKYNINTQLFTYYAFTCVCINFCLNWKITVNVSQKLYVIKIHGSGTKNHYKIILLHHTISQHCAHTCTFPYQVSSQISNDCFSSVPYLSNMAAADYSLVKNSGNVAAFIHREYKRKFSI